MKLIEQISDTLNQGAIYLTGFLTAAMTVIVFFQVIFRYVLNSPLTWSEEFSSFAFVWMALIGASVGLKYNQHPRLDIIVTLFPKNVQRMITGICNLPIMVMLLCLIVYSLRLAIAMRFQKTPALGYSISFVYGVLPVSAAIMLIHVIVQTALIFNKKDRELQK